jgi:phage repressor protein C with HTH and peptisase S24 domain
MDPILDEIDKALAAKGLSAAAASKLAAGHFSLIKNMKASKAEGERYSVETLKKLAQVLDLEFYFGPKRTPEPTAHVLVDDADYAIVPLHDATLSAGPGALNDDTTTVGALAFRSDWLRKQGLTPENAALARVAGESMQPTLAPGDMLLINTSDAAKNIPIKRHRPGKGQAPIYALMDGSEALVKRVFRPDDRTIVLLSDNPEWMPDVRTGRTAEGLRILGRVVWSARSWSDKIDG